MTADLMPFTYDGQTVRTVVIEGEPWFVGADVAAVLGYSNGRDAIARHVPESHRGVSWIATPSGDQHMTTLDEAGLYRLIMRANTDEAERFQEWVTATVLPAIRRTGSYSVTPQLEGAELLARAVLEAQSMLAAKDERIAELAPKADLADTYLTADSADRLVGQAAKLLRQKEKDLRRFLIEERLVFVRHSKCGVVQYEPYAEYSEHFAVHETVVNHTWGTCSHFTLRIRPRGIDLIRKRLAKTQLQPA